MYNVTDDKIINWYYATIHPNCNDDLDSKKVIDEIMEWIRQAVQDERDRITKGFEELGMLFPQPSKR